MLKLKKLKLLALAAALIASAVQVLPAQAAAADNGLQKEKVWFNRTQDNLKLAGEMYYPQNFDKNGKYPAIVVVHPGGGVKEQTAAIYAQKLAEKGFVTLAYDAAYQGESEGTPRFLEDPSSRVEDIHAALDYFDSRSFIDDGKLGALGICAGGGYAVHAAQTEHRIKAIATVSAVDSGRTRREGIGGTMTDESLRKTLDEVAQQRTLEAKGGEVRYINYVPNTLEQVPANNPLSDMYREFYEYYRTERGAHPRSQNIYRFSNLDKMFAYTAFDHVDWISPRPLLLIAGSNAGTKYLSEDAYQMAKEPKELYIIPGASHIDLYDRSVFVNTAVDKLAEFYHKYLK